LDTFDLLTLTFSIPIVSKYRDIKVVIT